MFPAVFLWQVSFAFASSSVFGSAVSSLASVFFFFFCHYSFRYSWHTSRSSVLRSSGRLCPLLHDSPPVLFSVLFSALVSGFTFSFTFSSKLKLIPPVYFSNSTSASFNNSSKMPITPSSSLSSSTNSNKASLSFSPDTSFKI